MRSSKKTGAKSKKEVREEVSHLPFILLVCPQAPYLRFKRKLHENWKKYLSATALFPGNGIFVLFFLTGFSFLMANRLIFAPTDKVDSIWTSIASEYARSYFVPIGNWIKLLASIAEGPLASTSAYLAKVATCPPLETPNYQHVICVYMPDVYNKSAVTEVRTRLLLRAHLRS